MHKIGFLGHHGGIKGMYAQIFNTKVYLVAGFYRENVSFTGKTANSRFRATVFFWGLRGNVCDSSLARPKADSRLSIGYK